MERVPTRETLTTLAADAPLCTAIVRFPVRIPTAEALPGVDRE
jgi:hypothetical protein